MVEAIGLGSDINKSVLQQFDTDKVVTTIEAIEADEVGKRVVAAWVEHQVAQCGYCQSGQVMAATALLKQTAAPSDAQIAAAMVNLCRCGTYNAIRTAVHDLAKGSV